MREARQIEENENLFQILTPEDYLGKVDRESADHAETTKSLVLPCEILM